VDFLSLATGFLSSALARPGKLTAVLYCIAQLRDALRVRMLREADQGVNRQGVAIDMSGLTREPEALAILISFVR
jgi:hypothetical protein